MQVNTSLAVHFKYWIAGGGNGFFDNFLWVLLKINLWVSLASQVYMQGTNLHPLVLSFGQALHVNN